MDTKIQQRVTMMVKKDKADFNAMQHELHTLGGLNISNIAYVSEKAEFFGETAKKVPMIAFVVVDFTISSIARWSAAAVRDAHSDVIAVLERHIGK